MKKIKLISFIFLTILTIPMNCNHIHDKKCGYNEATQTGCTHKHSDSCIVYSPNDGLGPDDPRG